MSTRKITILNKIKRDATKKARKKNQLKPKNIEAIGKKKRIEFYYRWTNGHNIY